MASTDRHYATFCCFSCRCVAAGAAATRPPINSRTSSGGIGEPFKVVVTPRLPKPGVSLGAQLHRIPLLLLLPLHPLLRKVTLNLHHRSSSSACRFASAKCTLCADAVAEKTCTKWFAPFLCGQRMRARHERTMGHPLASLYQRQTSCLSFNHYTSSSAGSAAAKGSPGLASSRRTKAKPLLYTAITHICTTTMMTPTSLMGAE